MRYFHKLLLGMLLLVTLSLSAVQCFTAANGLDNAFEHSLSAQITEHKLMRHAVQTAMLKVNLVRISPEEIKKIEENVGKLQSAGGKLEVLCGDAEEGGASADPGEISYEVVRGENGAALLVLRSEFYQQRKNVAVITKQDISSVFREAHEMQVRYTKLYFAVLGVCVAASLILSYALTRPIIALRNTSRDLADGNYDIRAGIKSRDEVGELAKAYNDMADTIQGKIRELEESNERQKRFIGSFAHELKTPMTSIIGYADTIYQKKLTPEQITQSAWYIMNEGMRLEAMAFKLMDLQSLHEGSFVLEQTEITTVLKDAAAAILPAAGERKISVEYDAEKCWVRLEYDLFKTMILNLLDNAMKSGTDRIILRGRCSGSEYEISVRDFGRGIPKAELDKITEAFYMVDKSRSRKEHGAGLGLALCVRIAELHGTVLNYDSRTGEGTTVSLRLNREDFCDEEIS